MDLTCSRVFTWAECHCEDHCRKQKNPHHLRDHQSDKVISSLDNANQITVSVDCKE